jgi:hypothetical protein
MENCMTDLDSLRDQMDGRLEQIEAYALDRARTPELKASLRSVMLQFGMPAISTEDLARLPVPTTLIWGHDDLQVRLRVAQADSARTDGACM